MKLEDQVCSLELAKRLKELGVKQESIFSWLHPWCQGWDQCEENGIQRGDGFRAIPYVENKKSFIVTDSDRHQGRHFVSAFTVAELGEMLPQYYQSGKLKVDIDRFSWFCGKQDCPANECAWDENEANARAKMLIHLIERGILKPEGGG